MKTAPAKPNTLEFKQDVPVIPEGLTLDQVWFSGGRTGLTILRHGGIGEILYYGHQALTAPTMFKSGNPVSSWEKLFRLCVVIDGTSYYPEFNNTRLYPFGYVSECTLSQVRFRHELLLLNDAVVHRIRVLSNPRKRKLSLKLIFHGFNRVNTGNRKWSPWKIDKKLGGITTVAVDSYSEEECRRQVESKMKDVRRHFPIPDSPYGETHIGIASTLPLSALPTHENWKYYLYSEDFTDEASLFIAFSPEAAGLTKRVRQLKSNVSRECDELFASWKERLATSPKITIPSSKVVQSCLANVPGIIDSLEVKDIPGGYRAGMQGYWLWLDLMLDANTFLYMNDASSLRDLLLFFKPFADDELGLPCLVTAQLKPHLGCPFNNQSVFVTALYSYYCYTGDAATLRECYPLARWLIERCLKQEVKGTGLIEGAGLPDFPAEQDGHDISASGNSYYYQAVMSLRYLSQELDRLTPGHGYGDIAATCDAAGKRCRESFIRYLYDEEKGYFIDSISSRDFSKRYHYPSFAIQWVTPFAADLIGNKARPIADFMAKHFTRPRGIGGLFPTWDKAYPGDGNQFLAYYPSWLEGLYRNVMKRAGRERELHKWFDDVAWFWQRYTIPEGFTYDAENEGFTPDNPGGKQGFGALAWYTVFFRSIIGFEVDERGVVVTPSPVQEEISARGLIVRGKKIDITVTGKGRRTEVIFNGEKKAGVTIVIPISDLKASNTLLIRRSD